MLSLVVALAVAAPDAHLGGDLVPPGQFLAGQGALILTHTDVHARVAADLAVVDVTQTFDNPFDEAIDATYVFPLPVDAGVRDMTVTCGERVVRSEILTKEEARERYDNARRDGQRAALLEQQTDRVFTQHVAGLCPGEQVVVTLQYVEALEVEHGVHTFVFPTTLGPRYDPGTLTEPPTVPSTRPGRDVSLHLDVDAGMPLASIWSDTLPIAVLEEDEDGAVVELVELDELPNKDVQVSWTQAADAPRVAAVATTDDRGDHYVSLSIVPPVPDALTSPRPRELVFVLDSSCSMQGEPWGAAVQTVELAMDQLRPGESFNLVRFSDAAGAAFPQPVPATAHNVAAAREWLSHFEGGGTEMRAGVIEALDQPGDDEALRMVLLLTDGYIGNERDLFRTARDHLGPNDRIFALGVGSSVNRLLLDGLAHHGRGAASYQLPGTPVAETVQTFYRRIDRPALTDIEVDWGTLGAEGAQLDALPDVFAGQPVHLVARTQAEAGVVTVRGRLDGAPWRTQIGVDMAEATPHEAVSTLWARQEIQAIERDLDRPQRAREDAVTALALDHRLVSSTTSLVAVDPLPGGCRAASQVDVPQLLPEGLSGSMASTVHPPAASSGGALGLGSAGGIRGGGRSGYGTGGGGTFGTKGTQVQATSGSPFIMGSLDRSTVDDGVKRHLNQIRYCYQRELATDPTLKGKLVVAFTIGTDGSVQSAELKLDTLGSEAVGKCVVGRFRRMHFPPAKGGGVIRISYPIQFVSSE